MRPLTKKQVEELKQRLLQEKRKLIFNNVQLSDEFNLDSEDMSDEVDRANAAEACAQGLRFRNREVFYMKKLMGALAKIEKGVYGECEECGEQIGQRRLSARPTADMCITCKEDRERDESLSFLGQQSKSWGRHVELAAATV